MGAYWRFYGNYWSGLSMTREKCVSPFVDYTTGFAQALLQSIFHSIFHSVRKITSHQLVKRTGNHPVLFTSWWLDISVSIVSKFPEASGHINIPSKILRLIRKSKHSYRGCSVVTTWLFLLRQVSKSNPIVDIAIYTRITWIHPLNDPWKHLSKQC